MNDKFFYKEKTRGRPRLVLNEDGKKMIEQLASIMCTDEEIASILGCVIETLQAKHNNAAFLESKQKGQNRGKSSLRRWQFESAQKGNVSMQMFLGKVYLGQKEYEETERKIPEINITVSPANKSDSD